MLEPAQTEHRKGIRFVILKHDFVFILVHVSQFCDHAFISVTVGRPWMESTIIFQFKIPAALSNEAIRQFLELKYGVLTLCISLAVRCKYQMSFSYIVNCSHPIHLLYNKYSGQLIVKLKTVHLNLYYLSKLSFDLTFEACHHSRTLLLPTAHHSTLFMDHDTLFNSYFCTVGWLIHKLKVKLIVDLTASAITSLR